MRWETVKHLADEADGQSASVHFIRVQDTNTQQQHVLEGISMLPLRK